MNRLDRHLNNSNLVILEFFNLTGQTWAIKLQRFLYTGINKILTNTIYLDLTIIFIFLSELCKRMKLLTDCFSTFGRLTGSFSPTK